MGLSLWQILIVVLLVVVLFGRGKITSLMGDMAQGIKAFKKGMNDDDDEPVEKVHKPQAIVDRKGDDTHTAEVATVVRADQAKQPSSIDKE